MKTWIWPLSWYMRIRELEAAVAVLTAKNRKLDEALRAQAMTQTSMTAAYVTAVASIAAMVTRS